MPASPPPPSESPAQKASHCPLCGQANDCAMAAGRPAHECWCMTTPIATEALARVPLADRGTRCICPHCAREFTPNTDAHPAGPI